MDCCVVRRCRDVGQCSGALRYKSRKDISAHSDVRRDGVHSVFPSDDSKRSIASASSGVGISQDGGCVQAFVSVRERVQGSLLYRHHAYALLAGDLHRARDIGCACGLRPYLA